MNAVTSVSYGGMESGRATLATTSGARVTLHAPSGARKLRTFERFKDVAYSGVLRDDGRALAVGGQQGVVQLFDCGSRAVLRKFSAHVAAVRAVRWSGDKLHLASASDDATVRLLIFLPGTAFEGTTGTRITCERWSGVRRLGKFGRAGRTITQ